MSFRKLKKLYRKPEPLVDDTCVCMVVAPDPESGVDKVSFVRQKPEMLEADSKLFDLKILLKNGSAELLKKSFRVSSDPLALVDAFVKSTRAFAEDNPFDIMDTPSDDQNITNTDDTNV